MEKRRPHYDLEAIKRAIGSEEKLVMSTVAARSAIDLGFDRASVAAVIMSIERRMFYKSMTTYANSREWQDVYHVRAGSMLLYVKFQADIIAEFQLISFKEK